MVIMQSQTLIFFQSCLLGMVIGLVYDFFRISRKAVKTHGVIVFLEDVCYFVFVSIASFVFIMMKNDGVLRGFLLIGELVGAILYFATLSILLLKIADKIICIIKTMLKAIYAITLKPLIRLFSWGVSLGKKMLNMIKAKLNTANLRHKRIKSDKVAQNKEQKQAKQSNKVTSKINFLRAINKKKNICMRNTNST